LQLEQSVKPFFDEHTKPDNQKADFILIEAEKRLQSQTAFLLASDTRALGLLSSAIALAAAALAFLGVALAEEHISLPMIFSSITITYNSIRAIHFSAAVLMPVKFKPSGWSPFNFYTDIEKGKSLLQIKIETINELQKRLDFNREKKELLDTSAKNALHQLAHAPVVAVIAFTMGLVSESLSNF
jgi:hypothetical protein